MKKLVVYLFVALFGVATMVSCTGKTACTSEAVNVDSTAVDTTLVDTLAVDSAVVDSVAL